MFLLIHLFQQIRPLTLSTVLRELLQKKAQAMSLDSKVIENYPLPDNTLLATHRARTKLHEALSQQNHLPQYLLSLQKILQVFLDELFDLQILPVALQATEIVIDAEVFNSQIDSLKKQLTEAKMSSSSPFFEMSSEFMLIQTFPNLLLIATNPAFQQSQDPLTLENMQKDLPS